ncbi:MAG: primosomal protein N' [Clostridia bacterium]|nr:primosomal protein N' [Clostridia bacterium]
MAYEYAKVCLTDDIPYPLDREFDYYIPAQMRSGVTRGAFVTVPFGRGNRRRLALVIDVCESSDTPADKIKPIDSLCPESMRLGEELLGLCRYLKEQTLCTIGDAVHAMIPAAAMSRLAEYYLPATGEHDVAALGKGRERDVLEYIIDHGKVSEASLTAKFGPRVYDSVKKLMHGGYVERGIDIKEGVREVFREHYSLDIDADTARAALEKQKGAPALRSETQRQVVEQLLGGECDIEALMQATGANRQQLRTLLDRKIIKVRRESVYRQPYSTVEQSERREYILNDEQRAAYEKLCELSRSGEGAAALLHGVTGSGKTCVMVKLIDEVIASGRSVILLLPEIALTPQSVAIFCARYGDRVAVIHSSLSAGERLDAYNKIRRGDADVVVGTRSAVFSPVRNLGLIIIDEEQEHTYKSDSDPKYHARDVARYRCAHERALLLLCSATPSVESYQKAIEGKYTLLKLKKRYGGAPLPSVRLADMREEAQAGNVDPLGSLLAEELKNTVGEGRQAVLFLNRRGYNNFVSCRICGAAIKCPRCSVAMHYHAKSGNYDDGVLVCHWCGHRQKQPEACPECGSPHLVRMGFGTQRLERDISDLLPDAKVLRMDADTTGEKQAYDKMLGEFRRHEADILLGTQMVTKGHDFPDVSLVGVLLADASLYLDDYRANERTFAMLTQVVGRAGRRDIPGAAVIQTNNPDNDVIRLACEQDYESFFENEIRLRRLLVFPPFCDIALLTLTSSDEKELMMGSSRLAQSLADLLATKYSDVPTVVFGPMEAPVYRVDGKYRVRMVIKCRLNKRSRALFSELLMTHTDSHLPTLSIDFNPSGL